VAYCSHDQLSLSGIPLTAYGNLTRAQLDAAREYGSQLIDGHAGGRYKLPIQQPYPPEFITWNAILASWQAINVRGHNPANPGERALKDRYAEVMALLLRMQQQAYHPTGIIEASSPSPAYAAPLVDSAPMQGWIPDPSNRGTPIPSGAL
jgi:hypothetical protein